MNRVGTAKHTRVLYGAIIANGEYFFKTREKINCSPYKNLFKNDQNHPKIIIVIRNEIPSHYFWLILYD